MRVSIRTCVPNLGSIRGSVRKNCLLSLIIDRHLLNRITFKKTTITHGTLSSKQQASRFAIHSSNLQDVEPSINQSYREIPGSTNIEMNAIFSIPTTQVNKNKASSIFSVTSQLNSCQADSPNINSQLACLHCPHETVCTTTTILFATVFNNMESSVPTNMKRNNSLPACYTKCYGNLNTCLVPEE